MWKQFIPKQTVILALLALSALPPLSAHGQDFGRLGVALKTGENAGPLGIQAAWNFTRHLQVCASVGGLPDPFESFGQARTDSYALQGKVFLDHLYFASAYVRKVSLLEEIVDQQPNRSTRAENGASFHVGYEFGHRRGFYFATSAGYLLLVGGGGKELKPGVNNDATNSNR